MIYARGHTYPVLRIGGVREEHQMSRRSGRKTPGLLPAPKRRYYPMSMKIMRLVTGLRCSSPRETEDRAGARVSRRRCFSLRAEPTLPRIPRPRSTGLRARALPNAPSQAAALLLRVGSPGTLSGESRRCRDPGRPGPPLTARPAGCSRLLNLVFLKYKTGVVMLPSVFVKNSHLCPFCSTIFS